MAKIADVKLKWTKSPSSGVKKVTVLVTVNGVEAEFTAEPTAESLMIVVPASGSGSFKVLTYGPEDELATSETYSFTLGDLETPLPATNLSHEVVAVRDDAPPAP